MTHLPMHLQAPASPSARMYRASYAAASLLAAALLVSFALGVASATTLVAAFLVSAPLSGVLAVLGVTGLLLTLVLVVPAYRSRDVLRWRSRPTPPLMSFPERRRRPRSRNHALADGWGESLVGAPQGEPDCEATGRASEIGLPEGDASENRGSRGRGPDDGWPRDPVTQARLVEAVRADGRQTDASRAETVRDTPSRHQSSRAVALPEEEVDPSVRRAEALDMASRDSFPASDPPAWASVRVGPPARGGGTASPAAVDRESKADPQATQQARARASLRPSFGVPRAMRLRHGRDPVLYHLLQGEHEVGTLRRVPTGDYMVEFEGFHTATLAAAGAWRAHWAWREYLARPGNAGSGYARSAHPHARLSDGPQSSRELTAEDRGAFVGLYHGGKAIARLRPSTTRSSADGVKREEANRVVGEGGVSRWAAELTIAPPGTNTVFVLAMARLMWEAIRRSGLWRHMGQWAPPAATTLETPPTQTIPWTGGR